MDTQRNNVYCYRERGNEVMRPVKESDQYFFLGTYQSMT